MNAYDRCQEFEERVFREYQAPLFAQKAPNGFTVLKGGRHEVDVQQRLGDVVYNHPASGAMTFIECKAERSYTGNLWLEEWSNRHKGNPGWMFKNDADWLAYFFMAHEVMYLIDQPRLKTWALPEPLGRGGMERFQLAKQTTHRQMNDGWGRLVPIDVIEREVGLIQYQGKPLEQVPYKGPLPRKKWTESDGSPTSST